MAKGKATPLAGGLIARKGAAVPAQASTVAEKKTIAITVRLDPKALPATQKAWRQLRAAQDQSGDHG